MRPSLDLSWWIHLLYPSCAGRSLSIHPCCLCLYLEHVCMQPWFDLLLCLFLPSVGCVAASLLLPLFVAGPPFSLPGGIGCKRVSLIYIGGASFPRVACEDGSLPRPVAGVVEIARCLSMSLLRHIVVFRSQRFVTHPFGWRLPAFAAGACGADPRGQRVRRQ